MLIRSMLIKSQLISSALIKRMLMTCGQRIAQTARLMVGVGNYTAYVQHMQLHHPEDAVLTREEHFRHCIDARDPKNGGKIHRCPC